MAGSIIGIDISDGRAVLVQALGGRRGGVRACAVLDAPPDAGPEEYAQCVAAYVRDNGLESDGYALAVSAGSVLSRHVSFPFTGADRIQKALGFELEQRLPVPVEGCVFSWLECGRASKGQNILVAAMRREVLAAYVDAFTKAGLPPQVIDLDVCAVSSVLAVIGCDVPPCALMLHVGPRTSRAVFLSGGKPCLLRFFETGTDMMQDGGNGAGARCLCREVRTSIAFAAETADCSPESIIVTGAGMRLDALRQALEVELGVPVQRPQVSDDARAVFPALDSEVFPDVLAAWGMTRRALKKGHGFNFCQGEFAYVNPRRRMRGNMLRSAGLAGLVILAMLTAFGAGLWRDANRLADGRQRIEDVFHEALPQVQGEFTIAQYRSILRSRLRELKGRHALGAKGGALPVLLAVTEAVPAGVDFTLTSLTMDDAQVSLTGTADGFATVEQLKKRLLAEESFHDVQIRSAQASADGARVTFEIVIRRGA